MDKIKPIETEYNGYKFRSRLEARWAVFFDELGIKYEYELEGFELPNGVRYLPDFYLPEMDVFVEVKPSFEVITTNDITKIFNFSVPKKLLIIVGTPTKERMFLFSIASADESIDYMISNFQTTNTQKQFELYAEEVEVEFFWDDVFCRYTLIPSGESIGFHMIKNRLNRCKLEAKQAQFEFGKLKKNNNKLKF